MKLNLDQVSEMIERQESILQLKIDTLNTYQQIDVEDDLLQWSKHRVEISAMALVRLKTYKMKLHKLEYDKILMELTQLSQSESKI